MLSIHSQNLCSIRGNNPDVADQCPARSTGLRVKNTFLQFVDDINEDDEQPSKIIRRSKTMGDRPLFEDESENSFGEWRMSLQSPDIAQEELEEAHATEYQSYDEPTTMMIRNFPNRSPIKYLVAALDSHGFAGTYDFIHAPYCFVKKQNFGYAFINFRDPALARAFLNQWQGQHIFVKKASVPVNISQAQIQGKAANLTRLVKDGKTKKITNPHLQPIVFDDDGHRVEFSAFVSKYVADIHTQK
eukprot:GEMP01046673.1.p1 GENE.GEMP01046673.1~~GEMP01046673.1.p1  ORF type:complete len:245 (+),score=35.68 GEMP01046673.1:94-828(+)